MSRAKQPYYPTLTSSVCRHGGSMASPVPVYQTLSVSQLDRPDTYCGSCYLCVVIVHRQPFAPSTRTSSLVVTSSIGLSLRSFGDQITQGRGTVLPF